MKHYPFDESVCDCMIAGNSHCAYHGCREKKCRKGQYNIILHVGLEIGKNIEDYFTYGMIR
jgi:hypothetical protein